MQKISQAFILAAGRGQRMRHLTDDKPKPLVTVAGKCLIDYNVEHLKAANINDCMVNLCYKGDMIKQHLLEKNLLNFSFSEEVEALETGGGIKNALPKMPKKPFFVINSDALWADNQSGSLLNDMQKAWETNKDKFDMLIMLQPISLSFGVGKNGDYSLNKEGYPVRRHDDQTIAPYIYGGVLICKPEIFDNEPEGKYSLVKIFDRLEAEKRLGAFVHNDKWFHVGDPEATQVAEKWFAK